MTSQSEQNWYDPQVSTFGDRLAGAREEAGMTQAELARRLGVRLKTVQAWEEDLSEPRANRLAMLAGLLNVSLSWLLTGEGAGPEAPADGAGRAADLDAALDAALAEIAALRVDLTRSAERLRQLEASLRAQMRADVLV